MKFLFLFAFISTVCAAQTVVQHCAGFGTGGAASTAVVTISSIGGTTGCTSNVTNGNTLVVNCGMDAGGTVNTPTDTLGGGQTWTSPTGANITGTSGAGNAKTFTATASASGAEVITCHSSTTGLDPHIDAWELSGLAASPFDQKGTAQSSATTPSVSTSGATAQCNELVIAFVQDSPNSRTITAGSGYSNLQASNNAVGGDVAAGESKMVTTTGTQTATFSGTSGDAVVLIVTTWKSSIAGSCGATACSNHVALMGAGCS